MKYFDVHSHFNLSQFDADRDQVIEQMEEAGVGTICVGTSLETSKLAIEITEKSNNIWACVGQHPTDTKDDFFADEFRSLLKHPKVVAIGECGLDYYRNGSDEIKAFERNLFMEQITLAIEIGKPLMIHARPSQGSMDAYMDVIAMLKAQAEHIHPHFHFYVGDLVVTKAALDIGATFSFDGPITFARDYDEVISYLPLEAIMAETDAPYAAPAPYRGQRNLPQYVRGIVAKLAQIRGISEEEMRVATLANTKRVFGIPLID